MMSKMMDVAQNALLAGAKPIRQLFGKDIKRLGAKYKPKDAGTLQTLIDTEAEKAVLRVIKRSPFSKDRIMAEESGESKGASNRTWYIDPVDGTANIPISLPMSTMALGVTEGERVVLGVILHPFEMEMLYAERGKGAFYVPLAIEDEEYIISGDPKPLVPTRASSPMQRYAWIDVFWNEHNSPRKAGWLSELHKFAINLREGGSNVDKPAKLARGKGHIQLTDCVGGFHDLAPGVVIMAEIGARYMDLDGNEPKPGCQLVVSCVEPELADPLLEMTNRYFGPESPLGPYKGFRG